MLDLRRRLHASYLIQIVTDRTGVVLFDDFHNHGTVILEDFFHDSVRCAIPIQVRFVMRHFFLNQPYCVIMFHILFQHKVECLADARGFYPFHFGTFFQKINVAYLRNRIYADMPLVTKIVYLILNLVSKDIFHKNWNCIVAKIFISEEQIGIRLRLALSYRVASFIHSAI